MLVHHPALLASIQRRSQSHPTALQSIECVLAALVGAGCTTDEAIAIYVQMLGFVTGMAAAELLREQAGRRTRSGRVLRANIGACVGRRCAEPRNDLQSCGGHQAAFRSWPEPWRMGRALERGRG